MEGTHRFDRAGLGLAIGAQMAVRVDDRPRRGHERPVEVHDNGAGDPAELRPHIERRTLTPAHTLII